MSIDIARAERTVGYIRDAAKDDYEAAHSLEDGLYVEVLIAVTKGSPDAARLAEIALSTQHISFARYCA